MGSKAQMAKWGNSLAIRIPKIIAQEAGLREGDSVEVVAQRGCVVVRPTRKLPTLKKLLSKITPENLHQETDWGLPVGKEVTR